MRACWHNCLHPHPLPFTYREGVFEVEDCLLPVCAACIGACTYRLHATQTSLRLASPSPKPMRCPPSPSRSQTLNPEPSYREGIFEVKDCLLPVCAACERAGAELDSLVAGLKRHIKVANKRVHVVIPGRQKQL